MPIFWKESFFHSVHFIFVWILELFTSSFNIIIDFPDTLLYTFLLTIFLKYKNVKIQFSSQYKKVLVQFCEKWGQTVYCFSFKNLYNVSPPFKTNDISVQSTHLSYIETLHYASDNESAETVQEIINRFVAQCQEYFHVTWQPAILRFSNVNATTAQTQ